jgi:hypothetical protein
LARSGLIKHAPQIAAGVGIGLALVAGIRAVQKTPEAVKRIEEKKEELEKDELTVMETVEATWKCYLPSIVIFILACLLIIGGQRISTRRAVAAATACSISDNMLQQYQEAAKAVVGEKKEEEIRAEAAKMKVNNKPPIESDHIISTGKGTALCYDELSKRYFWSDPDTVRKAILTLNERIMDERYISLNDYWSELGLPETTVGNLVSWCIDKDKLDPDYECVVVQDGPYKGWPCLVISFYCGPEYDYSDRN